MKETEQEMKPEIGDVIFDWDFHIFVIKQIEGKLITAECCHGDLMIFKKGEKNIYRLIS